MVRCPSLGSLELQLRQFLRVTQNQFVRIFIWICTLPYYRLFHFNTIDPIRRMAACTKTSDKFGTLLLLLARWRRRKLAELQFISIACAVLAGAVIGSFSWNIMPQTYWLASAFWYGCLVLSILGILLSAQQVAVLNILGPLPDDEGSQKTFNAVRRYLPLLLSEQKSEMEAQYISPDSLGVWNVRWKMVFTWQCPIMFMSYSVCLFLAGLTVVVCSPLIRKDPWGPSSYIAVVYLALCALAGLSFVFCSFWVYHYVDLERVDHAVDIEDGHDVEMGEHELSQYSMSRT